jgi:addiction module RelE/StbE family toxin
MNISFSKRARKQLRAIYRYYEQRNTKAAINIYNNILDEIERLLIFPEMAPREPALRGFIKVYRSLVIRKTYKAIYRIENDTIYIIAIWNCRRDPDKLKDEIKE